MRWAVDEIFENLISMVAPEIKNVAILGGTRGDSEYRILEKYNREIQSRVYGIEDLDAGDCYQDLNESFKPTETYDLVLCSQVLEHLWDHQNFFDSLEVLSHSGSYIWINCPASNFAHGSPSYFSAGFTSDYVANNLLKRNFSIINHGNLGSERYYKVLHLRHQWLTENVHNKLILGKPIIGKRLRSKMRTLLLRIAQHIFLLRTIKTVSTELTYATESWVLAKKAY